MENGATRKFHHKLWSFFIIPGWFWASIWRACSSALWSFLSSSAPVSIGSIFRKTGKFQAGISAIFGAKSSVSSPLCASRCAHPPWPSLPSIGKKIIGGCVTRIFGRFEFPASRRVRYRWRHRYVIAVYRRKTKAKSAKLTKLKSPWRKISDR